MDRQQRIAETAYLLWEKQGRHPGADDAYWKAAEKIIEEREFWEKITIYKFFVEERKDK